MRSRVLFCALSVIVGIYVVACGEKLAPAPAGAPDAASAVDAAGDAVAEPNSGTCTLTNGKCTGDSRCCPNSAFRVDLVRGCKASMETAFSCEPPSGPPVTTPNIKRCAHSDETSCFWRGADGGTDSGDSADIEVYYSSYYIRVPGYEVCDTDLYSRVLAAFPHACPN